MTTAKFEDNFWGEGNHGFEALLHNFKSQITASKELGDYIRERSLVEDAYAKSLSKLHKTISEVKESHFGAFLPMWKLVRDTSDKLASVHAQFYKMLSELAHEISEYNIAQREKAKISIKGEIDAASGSLIALRTLDGQIQRTKKQYHQGVEHLAKAQEKLNRAVADPTINAKTKQHLESKTKQAQTWMETMKSDHQQAVKRQCEHLMEFQGKMKEACMKFESLEEEHLAQMSTFMLKMARSQNSTLVNTEQHYAAFNSYLDDLSVEKLLLEFVQAKSTGTEKPTPYKFRPITVDVPAISLSASVEDISRGGSSSPTPERKNTARPEKSIRGRFLKKKQKTVPNGPIEEHQQPENAPEVDEEGYSIRPDNASSISQFPDEPSRSRNDSDSDSDFGDDEPEHRIKTLKIKEKAGHPQATVDDINKAVMSLKVGVVSSGIKKATSTHSLDALSTPPIKRPSSTGTNKQTEDSKSVSSLLDLDDLITGPTSHGSSSVLEPEPSSLPPPLLPSLFNLDPMATLTPLSVPPPSTQSSAMPTSSISSSILIPTTVSGGAADSEKSSSDLVPDPGISFGTKDGTLKANGQNQPQPDLFAAFEEAKDQPTPLPRGGAIPPLPDKKKRSTGTPPSTSSVTSATGSVTKTSSGYSIVSISSEKSVDSFAAFETNFGSGTSQEGSQPNTPTAQVEGQSSSASKTSGASPRPSSKDTATTKDPPVQGILPPPIAAPRRGSASRRRVSNPPPTGGGVDHLGQVQSPLATAQVATSRSTSTSPISFSGGAATNGPTTSPQHASARSSPSGGVVPIAVAIQETCNAIFKGNDMSKCTVKVNGEVMISFPAGFVGQLSAHEVLAFKLSSVDNVERLLHNQHLLKKEEDGFTYRFDMPALVANLKQIKEKQNSPYCNIQILKYEVKASGGNQLPLKLVSFWKCEPSITNFRLDYVYQPHNLKQSKKPAMTNLSVVVPVSGGVRKSLAKPDGSWVAEQNRMMWKLSDLQPTEQGRGTLHAKFDVTNGPTVPAPATVHFLCDGATMSGITFELSNDAYKVSLLKNKCLSGKYTAEIVHHY